MKSTWSPTENFAYPSIQKVPLRNAKDVQAAIAQFEDILDVTDDERLTAFANIREAAKYYDVDISETDWRQLAPRRRGAQK